MDMMKPQDMTLRRGKTGEAKFYIGQIDSVNTSTGKCVVKVPYLNKAIDHPILCQPYMHPFSDEGIHFMPRTGSWCIIMNLEEQYYILPSFFAPFSPNTQTFWGNAKSNMQEGDSWMSTEKGNDIKVTSSGVTEHFVNGFARSIYLRIEQFAKHLYRRWFLQTDAGVEEYTSEDSTNLAKYRKELSTTCVGPGVYRMYVNTDQHCRWEIWSQNGQKELGTVNWLNDGNLKITITDPGVIYIDGLRGGRMDWVARHDDTLYGTTGTVANGDDNPGHIHYLDDRGKINSHSDCMKCT